MHFSFVVDVCCCCCLRLSSIDDGRHMWYHNVRRDSEAMNEGVVLLLYWKRVPLKTPMETMAAEWEDIIVLAMTIGSV